ncbi:MAG TPA: DUF1524 domain-containing protein [Arenibaculum sp.]|nr:DUF1524 domain-containing protein [Arenibaculum sp.]
MLLIVAAGLLLDQTGMLPTALRAPLEALVADLTGAPAARPPPGIPDVARDAGPAPDMDQAATLLERIPVRAERASGYERDDWPHWGDADGNCLNTREEVLVAESLVPATLTRDGCGVRQGRWRDPYTGREHTDPRDVDIDHVVALQEAHQSGGWAWDRDRRTAFANDLSDPRSLTVSASGVNREKGARGPEDWLPPEPALRCRFVADWIAVKARWDLAMDAAEHAAASDLVAACGGGANARTASR